MSLAIRIRAPLTFTRRHAATVLAAATLVLPLLIATPALAAGPLYRAWTLSGVTFADGGTLSGTLVIQSDGTPVDFDVTMAGGDTATFGTNHYTGTPSPLSGDGPANGWYLWAPGGVGAQYLNLKLPDTTGATSGTSLPLATPNASWECTNCTHIRYVNAGSIVAGGAAGAATTVSVSSDHNPAGLGGTVTFTATVSSGGGRPSGQVTFRDTTTSTDLCSGVSLDGSGVATCSASTSALGLGGHSIRASFGGTPFFQPSADSMGQVIARAVAAVSLHVSPHPSAYRQLVHIEAHVTTAATGIGAPTGTVDIYVNGSAVCFRLPSDAASCDMLDGLNVGINHLTARYSGDSTFRPATSAALRQVVSPVDTTTTLSVSPAYVPRGQRVQLTATVKTTVPTFRSGPYAVFGSVQFMVDGQKVGNRVDLVGGHATLSLKASLVRGSHHVRAFFVQSPIYFASSSPGMLLYVH